MGSRLLRAPTALHQNSPILGHFPAQLSQHPVRPGTSGDSTRSGMWDRSSQGGLAGWMETRVQILSFYRRGNSSSERKAVATASLKKGRWRRGKLLDKSLLLPGSKTASRSHSDSQVGHLCLVPSLLDFPIPSRKPWPPLAVTVGGPASLTGQEAPGVQGPTQQ